MSVARLPRLPIRAGRSPANVVRPPRLRTVESTGEERHASWGELFFDLVFVAAIAELAHNLGGDLSAGGFLRFVALFVPIWWMWVGYTFYDDRFDTDDAVYRLLMLTGMLAIAALAVTVHDALSGGSAAFAIAYIAARLVLIVQYVRAYRHVPAARALCVRYIIAFSGGVAVWAISLLFAPPTRY